MQSLKTGETHDPLRYGLIESFKPWAESLVGTLRLLVPISLLVVFVLVSKPKDDDPLFSSVGIRPIDLFNVSGRRSMSYASALMEGIGGVIFVFEQVHVTSLADNSQSYENGWTPWSGLLSYMSPSNQPPSPCINSVM